MTEPELLELLKQKYGKIRLSGDWIAVPCPTCNLHHRKKMKRYVHRKYLSSHCFICHVHMDSEQLLGEGIMSVVTQTDGSPIIDTPKEPHPWSTRLPGYRFIPVNALPEGHAAVKFLNKDHLFNLDSYYSNNGIVYCPADSGVIIFDKPFTTSADRLIFPVTYKGELVGWQMRSIPGTVFGDRPSVLRYIHLFNKANYLYNYDNAIKYGSVIVTEGVKKALKFPNGVATFGKGIAASQVQQLQEWPIVIFLYDAEEEAQEVGKRVTAAINAEAKSKALNINLGKYGIPSPDEADSETLINIINKELEQ